MSATGKFRPVWSVRINRNPNQRGLWLHINRFIVGDVVYHRTVSIGLWFVSFYRGNRRR